MHVVVGLGVTGLSCVQYLKQRGESVTLMDAHVNPPLKAQCLDDLDGVTCYFGGMDAAVLADATRIIVSPGVRLDDAAFTLARQRQVPIVSDMQLFAEAIQKPIYAVTGSNGKTTLVTLLGMMADQSGLSVSVAGNIGTPVLSVLAVESSAYVLECSSFQLDVTPCLSARAACIMNVSPDHLDRHGTMAAYIEAKQKIYTGCDVAVHNLDDPSTAPFCHFSNHQVTFSLHSLKADYRVSGGQLFGFGRSLMRVDQLAQSGQHHVSNALCALAMGTTMGCDPAAMVAVLRQFSGLPHRMQWVRTHLGVRWVNDSKATNIGASQAAIKSLRPNIAGRLWLIAGGDAKGADFANYAAEVVPLLAGVVLIGRDQLKMAAALGSSIAIYCADSLSEAVYTMARLAHSGDAVLLSPACASQDMFLNYEDRGDQFMQLVHSL